MPNALTLWYFAPNLALPLSLVTRDHGKREEAPIHVEAKHVSTLFTILFIIYKSPPPSSVSGKSMVWGALSNNGLPLWWCQTMCMFDKLHSAFNFKFKVSRDVFKNRNERQLTSTFSFKMSSQCHMLSSTCHFTFSSVN